MYTLAPGYEKSPLSKRQSLVETKCITGLHSDQSQVLIFSQANI